MNQEEASDNKQQHPAVQTLSNSAATELPGHLSGHGATRAYIIADRRYA